MVISPVLPSILGRVLSQRVYYSTPTLQVTATSSCMSSFFFFSFVDPILIHI